MLSQRCSLGVPIRHVRQQHTSRRSIVVQRACHHCSALPRASFSNGPICLEKADALPAMAREGKRSVLPKTMTFIHRQGDVATCEVCSHSEVDRVGRDPCGSRGSRRRMEEAHDSRSELRGRWCQVESSRCRNSSTICVYGEERVWICIKL